MSKEPITNHSISAALEGRDLAAEAAADDVVKLLNGEPTAAAEAQNQSIVESLQGKAPTLRLNESGADRAEGMWVADLALEAADSALGTALMRKHPGLTAGVLAKEARDILQECYDEAGHITDNEVERRQVAADQAKQIAAEMNDATPTATRVAESAPATIASAPTPTGADQSPIVVVYESLDGKELYRHRLTAEESKKLANQPNGSLVVEQAKRIYEVSNGAIAP